MVEVILIGHARGVRKNGRLGHVGNKERMRAAVDFFDDVPRNHGICISADKAHAVCRAALRLIAGEFIGISAARKAELLEYAKRVLPSSARTD